MANISAVAYLPTQQIESNSSTELGLWFWPPCKLMSNIHSPFTFVFGLHQLPREISGFSAAKCHCVDQLVAVSVCPLFGAGQVQWRGFVVAVVVVFSENSCLLCLKSALMRVNEWLKQLMLWAIKKQNSNLKEAKMLWWAGGICRVGQ